MTMDQDSLNILYSTNLYSYNILNRYPYNIFNFAGSDVHINIVTSSVITLIFVVKSITPGSRRTEAWCQIALV